MSLTIPRQKGDFESGNMSFVEWLWDHLFGGGGQIKNNDCDAVTSLTSDIPKPCLQALDNTFRRLDCGEVIN